MLSQGGRDEFEGAFALSMADLPSAPPPNSVLEALLRDERIPSGILHLILDKAAGKSQKRRAAIAMSGRKLRDALLRAAGPGPSPPKVCALTFLFNQIEKKVLPRLPPSPPLPLSLNAMRRAPLRSGIPAPRSASTRFTTSNAPSR